MSLNIEEMIRDMLEENDAGKRISLAEAVLAEEPDNPIAKYVKWYCIRAACAPDQGNPEENIKLLREVSASLRDKAHKPGDPNALYEILPTYLSMLSDLSCELYFNDEEDEALPFVQELTDLDNEGSMSGRFLYYPILIQKKEYAKIVADGDSDERKTPVCMYCRAFALFELGRHHEAALEVLDAINDEPEMIFYIIGAKEIDELFDEPESFSGDFSSQTILIANILYGGDGAELDEEKYSFIGEIGLLFGYLTKRLPDEDIAKLDEVYEEFGIMDELKAYRAKKIPEGWENEEALAKIKELSEKGLLSFNNLD
ncbi:hypothetical protein FACS1894216_00830 [Synergistales bacterium]|nr:hypothetical protein FACS1894216_00830 [Synergistales bacterium]